MAKTEENVLSTNLRTVKELILDEHKLVTYISLAKDLCCHVNEAKLLLHQVVEDIKRKKININVSFIVSGLYSDKLARTIVCTESDLETEKRKLKTVFFQHIYSVCQGSECVDNAAYIYLNKFEDFSLCAGLIKGDMCIKRSSDEIGTLTSNSQPTVDEAKKPVAVKKENKDKSKNTLQNGFKDNNIVKIHETKSEPIIKAEVISPKKDAATNSSNGKHNIKNGGKVNKGIAGFFTKSNSTPNTKPIKTVKETIKEVPIKTHIKPEVKEEIMDIDEEEIVRDIKKKPEIAKQNNKKNSNSLNEIKKNAKVDKKRKRVLHVSDSESEGENDPFVDKQETNYESEDEIPPTPSTNTFKFTAGILNPKKKRKIVDKTYTDEEGYILTRKEEVFESCSEDEVETKEPIEKPEKENMKQINKPKTEVSPKEKAKITKKKVTPPQKGKQGNIMSFFKKV